MSGEIFLEIVKLFPALAITAVFIWYELKRQAQWAVERQEMRGEFIQFLTEQRVATLAVMDMMAMRLQQLGEMIVSVRDCTHRMEKAFDSHDTRAENIGVAIESLRARVHHNGAEPERVTEK